VAGGSPGTATEAGLRPGCPATDHHDHAKAGEHHHELHDERLAGVDHDHGRAGRRAHDRVVFHDHPAPAGHHDDDAALLVELDHHDNHDDAAAPALDVTSAESQEGTVWRLRRRVVAPMISRIPK
jgi:hypothetical protein